MDMNIKSIAGIAITVAISAIMFTALLMPTIASASWETKEYSNVEESVYYMEAPTSANAGKTIAYTWTKSTGVLTANDASYALPDTEGYTWAYLGLGMLRIAKGATDNFTATLTVNNNDTATLTITGGATHTIGSNGYYISDAPSDHVMMRANPTGTYYTEEEPILFAGITTINSALHTFRFDYDGEITWDNIVPATSTVSNVQSHTNKIYETTNVYKLEKITFDCTTADGNSRECVYSYGIAPTTVTGVNANPAIASMVSVVPILVLAGLVIGVVGCIIRNRD